MTMMVISQPKHQARSGLGWIRLTADWWAAPSETGRFVLANIAPTVPSEIASTVQKVVGITGGPQKASLYKVGKTLGENPVTPSVRTDTAGGTGPGGTYAARDLRTAYQIPAFGGVSPQVVAVFEDSGIRTGDYRRYLKNNLLPAIPLKQIPVEQATPQIWVTSVGGTTLFTYSQKQYLGEIVWNGLGLYPGAGATGGGVSDLWNAREIWIYTPLHSWVPISLAIENLDG